MGNTVSIATNIVEYNTMLGRYMAMTKLLPDEVLEKKGRALGIALFKGFDAHKFGGPGKKKRHLAEEEFAARVEQGKGIRIRASLLEAYKAERGKFGSSIRSLGQLGRYAKIKAAKRPGWLSDLDKQHGAENTEIGAAIRKLNAIRQANMRAEIQAAAKSFLAESRKMRSLRRNLWQRIVGKELSARQAGIGMLAASFLWYRKRTSQAKGTYLVPNRTGKPLGYVEKGDGYLRIVGEAAGLEVVDPRYGIVSQALAVETADMVPYIERKEREIFGRTLGGNAA